MAYDPEYHRNYYQANKEKKRLQGKEWANNNKDRVRELSRLNAQKRREENPEGYREAAIRYEKKNPEKILLKAAKTRATKKGFDFSITSEDIQIPEFCPLLGIKLEFKRGHGRGPNDNSPTLDRINSELGYIKGNVWVISAKANRIKTDAQIEEIIMVAENLQKLLGKK
jgi:hypothetical protein